jgi:hypothetical protein
MQQFNELQKQFNELQKQFNELQKQFKPDYTPKEIFMQGSFMDQQDIFSPLGGYFRPIYSTVLNKVVKNDYSKYRCLDGIPLNLLITTEPGHIHNKYKVKAGLSLKQWESYGWIHPQNPRGWLEWYCGYTDGHRTPDDSRQIKRWIGMRNRFCGIKDKSQSPVVKQTLLHWGIDWRKC